MKRPADRLSHPPRPLALCAGAVLCALSATLLTGCPPPEGLNMQQVRPIPLNKLIDDINANNRRTTMTLKAVGGHASGRFVEPDGTVRNFDLDANLLIRTPRHMRLDLKTLLESQLIFGSNDLKYWAIQPGLNALTWGRHNRETIPNADDMMIRPDLFVEALGLAVLPEDTTGNNGPMMRNTANYQQLFFIGYDNDGQAYVEKEYWVSRTTPPLIRRVIFRDVQGAIVLDSQIGDYRRPLSDGPLLPHRIDLFAPGSESQLLFTTLSWKPMPEILEDHPAFAFPLDRGAEFDRIVDLDAELDNQRNPLSERERLLQQYAPYE